MSHFTRVKTKLVDMLHLKRALDDLDLNYEEGKVKIRGYMGRKMEVDLRVKMPGGYDIGFKRVGDTIEAVADWDMIKNTTQETFVAEVTRRYATSVVKEQLSLEDFSLVEENRQGNQITLTMRRM